MDLRPRIRDWIDKLSTGTLSEKDLQEDDQYFLD